MFTTQRRTGFIGALLLLLALPAASSTIKDTFDKTWDVTQERALVLSNENGSIEIQSWDRDQVRVHAEIDLRAGSRSAAEEAMAQLKIDAIRNGDTISVRTHKPKGSDGFFAWLAGRHLDVTVHYEITVPSRFDVDIETVNGSIDARSLDGSLRFDTVNGRIEVHDSRGTVSADTVNGSIDVEILEVEGNGRMTFATTNGGVRLTLPSTIAADLDASTTNGKIATNIPVSTHSVSRSRLRGTLNGGGPEIKVRTVNGSIRIDKSS